jgi:TrmH family RNA methyltransferase
VLSKSQTKYIQSLGHKKFRDEAGMFIAEGPKIMDELLVSSADHLHQVFALPEWITEHRGQTGKLNVVAVEEHELQRISQLSTPNKVLAVVRKFHPGNAIVIKDRVSLVLDTIRDPGNMGTIIRIADWFGISQVICSADCADIYNPKVVQSTMGSIARVKIYYTDLVALLAGQQDIRIYAAALEGRDVTAMNKITEGLIIIGNESKGIDQGISELAHVKIHIPRKGKAESLNAAVAAGIILSHLV